MDKILPLNSQAVMARLPETIVSSNSYYEPIDYYDPKVPYSNRVQAALPSFWRLKRNGVWVHAIPPQSRLPLQGWKIHVSANLDNADEILDKVTETCQTDKVTFKFLLDDFALRMCNSKNMSRGSSGKFITIYPNDGSQFEALLEQLYDKLSGFEGAYILSDTRFKDCKVLYYRYGGFSRIESANQNGDNQLHVVAPDGSLYPDKRSAYFDPPPWVDDPFPRETVDEQEEPTLKNGRYLVEEVLRFTNAGGVYKAIDQRTQEIVVIKEARPGTELESKGVDACSLRMREWDILCRLKALNVVPQPIDFFTDWEHTYLVESFVKGKTLWDFVVEKNSLSIHMMPGAPRRTRNMWSY